MNSALIRSRLVNLTLLFKPSGLKNGFTRMFGSTRCLFKLPLSAIAGCLLQTSGFHSLLKQTITLAK